MRQTLIVAVALALSACATQTARFEKDCEGYGHKPGAAAFNQCVTQERKIHHAQVDAEIAQQAAAQASTAAQQQSIRTPYCTPSLSGGAPICY